MYQKIFAKLGLKKSRDLDINMKKNNQKNFFPKLGLKKSQDIESMYKEPMSNEGPDFPIFRRRTIKKKPTVIGKPTLGKIKGLQLL